MDASGAQEILMPVVHSAESWKATGRWSTIDATLTRFRDRRGHDMVLGMTHEETFVPKLFCQQRDLDHCTSLGVGEYRNS
jgi:prolyl-tRNA synthetase